MYALKRIAAYAIDMALVYTPLAALIGYGEAPFMGQLSPHLHMFASLGAIGLRLRRADSHQWRLDRADRVLAWQVHHVLERQRRRRRPSRNRPGHSPRDHQGRLAGLLLRHDLRPSRPGHSRADLLRRVARPRCRRPEALRPHRDAEELAEVSPRAGQTQSPLTLRQSTIERRHPRANISDRPGFVAGQLESRRRSRRPSRSLESALDSRQTILPGSNAASP